MLKERMGGSISVSLTMLAAVFVLSAAFVLVLSVDEQSPAADDIAILSSDNPFSDGVALAFYDETPYGTPQWPWFFVGVLIGIVLALVIWRVWHNDRKEV